jgi:solute carrier family 25 S-adenosylmethionine transporter 26
MLGSDSSGRPYEGVVDTFNRLLLEQNNNNNIYNSNSNYWNRYRIFFSGVGPRVMWISIGGFVFFGAYEKSFSMLKTII